MRLLDLKCICVFQDGSCEGFVCLEYNFFFSHLVDVSAFRMLRVRFALSVLVLMCSEKVNIGSNARLTILGRFCVGITLL